jgi:hypothetical protein
MCVRTSVLCVGGVGVRICACEQEDIQEDGVYLVVTISEADDAVLDLASADLQVSCDCNCDCKL